MRQRFLLDERRSGFDNRHSGRTGLATCLDLPYRLASFLRSRRKVLLIILLLINGANLADFFLTLHALAHGHWEMNPVMRALLATDPLLAGLFKVGAGLGTSLVIWYYRRFRIILQFALMALGFYFLLIAYHVVGAWFS